MHVVVVESPAKAKTIEGYLGSSYKVIASFGHIRDLPSSEGSVKPDDNFEMSWEMDTKGKKQTKKELLHRPEERHPIQLALTAYLLYRQISLLLVETQLLSLLGKGGGGLTGGRGSYVDVRRCTTTYVNVRRRTSTCVEVRPPPCSSPPLPSNDPEANRHTE